MQGQAIHVALNTPDIALIQGQPGTGKTTVIAAILERLNELSDKRGSIRGQVLLTGFQHDAVENLMLRLTINSLPVPKFGRRSGESAEAAVDRAAERLRQWCDQVVARLRESNPHSLCPSTNDPWCCSATSTDWHRRSTMRST